jgi:hypothetical protein
MSLKYFSSYIIRIITITFLLLILLVYNINSFAAYSDQKTIYYDLPNSVTEKSLTFNPYFAQSIHLKWLEEGNIGDFQGLLIPELGIIIKGDSHYDISVYFDFSIAAHIYDIYNIQFAPISFNINQAYLNYKTEFSKKYMPDSFKVELYSDNDNTIYHDNLYNLGLETTWISEKDIKIYTEYLFYYFVSRDGIEVSKNNFGLKLGTKCYDVFKSKDGKDTDIRIEYSGIKNQILLQINQQINKDLSLEFDYTQNSNLNNGENYYLLSSHSLPDIIGKSHNFSTSLIYDINKNCQLQLTGLLNSTRNIDNQSNQYIKEYSLITSINYKF